MSNSTGQETIGDRIKNGQSNAIKTIVILIGFVIYIAFLIFSAVHNYSLLTTGIREDLLMWSTLGVFTLELSAVGLPLALHYWTFAPSHRTWAIIFYILDFLIIILNIVLDFQINSMGGRANVTDAWLIFYLDYLAPATPVIPGISWTVLFLLDPHSKKKQIEQTLAMATLETISEAMIEETRHNDKIKEVVAQGAVKQASFLVAKTVATMLQESGAGLPANIIDAVARDVTPTNRTRQPRTSLIDGLFNGADHFFNRLDQLVNPRNNAPRQYAQVVPTVKPEEVELPTDGYKVSGNGKANGSQPPDFTNPGK